MEEEKKKAYSEVVEILKLIDNEEKIEKIPFEVIELIKANSDPTYKPNINKEIPLEEQGLRNETYSILGWIASKYWEEDLEISSNSEFIEEKEQEKSVEKIEEIEQEDTENIIRNASVYNDIEPECLEGKNLPILASSIGWFERIKIKVIKLFKMLFRLDTKKEGEGVNE